MPLNPILLELATKRAKDDDGPGPPPNYRPAVGQVNRCASCNNFESSGMCLKFKTPVDPNFVCDEYEQKALDLPTSASVSPGAGTLDAGLAPVVAGAGTEVKMSSTKAAQTLNMGTGSIMPPGAPTQRPSMLPAQALPTAKPLVGAQPGDPSINPGPPQPTQQAEAQPTTSGAFVAPQTPQTQSQAQPPPPQEQAQAPQPGAFKPSPVVALYGGHPALEAYAQFVAPDPNVPVAKQARDEARKAQKALILGLASASERAKEAATVAQVLEIGTSKRRRKSARANLTGMCREAERLAIVKMGAIGVAGNAHPPASMVNNAVTGAGPVGKGSSMPATGAGPRLNPQPTGAGQDTKLSGVPQVRTKLSSLVSPSTPSTQGGQQSTARIMTTEINMVNNLLSYGNTLEQHLTAKQAELKQESDVLGLSALAEHAVALLKSAANPVDTLAGQNRYAVGGSAWFQQQRELGRSPADIMNEAKLLRQHRYNEQPAPPSPTMSWGQFNAQEDPKARAYEAQSYRPSKSVPTPAPASAPAPAPTSGTSGLRQGLLESFGGPNQMSWGQFNAQEDPKDRAYKAQQAARSAWAANPADPKSRQAYLDTDRAEYDAAAAHHAQLQSTMRDIGPFTRGAYKPPVTGPSGLAPAPDLSGAKKLVAPKPTKQLTATPTAGPKLASADNAINLLVERAVELTIKRAWEWARHAALILVKRGDVDEMVERAINSTRTGGAPGSPVPTAPPASHVRDTDYSSGGGTSYNDGGGGDYGAPETPSPSAPAKPAPTEVAEAPAVAGAGVAGAGAEAPAAPAPAQPNMAQMVAEQQAQMLQMQNQQRASQQMMRNPVYRRWAQQQALQQNPEYQRFQQAQQRGETAGAAPTFISPTTRGASSANPRGEAATYVRKKMEAEKQRYAQSGQPLPSHVERYFASQPQAPMAPAPTSAPAPATTPQSVNLPRSAEEMSGAPHQAPNLPPGATASSDAGPLAPGTNPNPYVTGGFAAAPEPARGVEGPGGMLPNTATGRPYKGDTSIPGRYGLNNTFPRLAARARGDTSVTGGDATQQSYEGRPVLQSPVATARPNIRPSGGNNAGAAPKPTPITAAPKPALIHEPESSGKTPFSPGGS